jgi:predicted ATP-dependent serine protease
MKTDQFEGQEAMELVKKTLGNPLMPGELGALMARAGVGKTACLTHIALEHLFESQPVLHVCIDEGAEKIKIWYRELMKNLLPSSSKDEFATLQRRLEGRRFILAYLHQTFSVKKLEQSLQNLEEQTHFHPALVVLDGLHFDHEPRTIVAELQSFAHKHQVSMWMSMTTHRHIAISNERGIPYPCHETEDLFQAILSLEPGPEAIHVRVFKHGERYRPEHPDVFLNPQSYLLQKS